MGAGTLQALSTLPNKSRSNGQSRNASLLLGTGTRHHRDGYVDIQDAILVLRHAMSISELTAEQQLIADVNGDGFVNTSDAVMIERIAMGIAS